MDDGSGALSQTRGPCEQPTLGKIHCRLKNYEPLTQLKNLKANYYGECGIISYVILHVDALGLGKGCYFDGTLRVESLFVCFIGNAN